MSAPMSSRLVIANAILPIKSSEGRGGGYQMVNVTIEGTKIVAITPAEERNWGNDVEVVDATDKMILPGFVNAHTHSSEMWARGLIEPVPLELWLPDLIDNTPEDAQAHYLAALHTAIETLLSGGTTVLDHIAVIPGKEEEIFGEVVKAYRQVGIRAVIGPLVSDLPILESVPHGAATTSPPPLDPATYLPRTKELLAIMRRLIERYHRPEEGIIVAVAPTGVQRCSEELFRGMIELSREFDLPRHCHVLETRAQKQIGVERCGGRTVVKYLADLGWFTEKTTAAHSIWLTDDDIDIIARTGATVVHNPLSNLRLGSGFAPLAKYRARNVSVAIGCDGAASNDSQDLLEAVKLATIMHNPLDVEYRHWLSPFETALGMAAAGGARGIGMGAELGEIAVGRTADIVLYDLKRLSVLPRTDPLGLLVLGKPVNVVDSVWVAGKQVVGPGGKVRGVDVEALQAELFARSKWVFQRPNGVVHNIRPPVEEKYRKAFQLDPSVRS